MTFPLKNGTPWPLHPSVATDLQQCYRHLLVEDELDKARIWLIANPSKRKTARGMLRYLTHWLNVADENRLKGRRQLVRNLGPTYQNLGSWRDECDRVHGGHNGDFCGNQTMHHARMQRQVTA